MSLISKVSDSLVSYARSWGFDPSVGGRSVRSVGLAGLAAGLLTACPDPSGDGGVNPPPPGPDRPSFECVGVSASEYGSGLPFDVSSYDSNDPGCFTVDERALVDHLSQIYDREVSGRDSDDGAVITVDTLQGIVDRFVTVGPVIPSAVWLSYEGFVADRVFDSELVFDASTIGSLSLHQMLPVWSLPSRYADPDVDTGGFDPVIFEPPTDFPPNHAVNNVSGPDWLNEDRSQLLSGLKLFAGVGECNAGENILNVSSINMNLHREFDPDSPTLQQILWREVSLPTLPGSDVEVRQIFIERRGPFEHDRANVVFREHIHPYDRTLVDTPWRDHSLGHVVPGFDVSSLDDDPDLGRYFSRDDFALSEGDRGVSAGDVRLFVTPYMPAFLLDYVLTVPSDFGEGYDIAVHQSMMEDSEFRNAFLSGAIPSLSDGLGPIRGSGKRVVDVMMARFYPDGLQMRPIETRYSQNLKVYAPCTVFSAEPSTR